MTRIHKYHTYVLRVYFTMQLFRTFSLLSVRAPFPQQAKTELRAEKGRLDAVVEVWARFVQ